MIVRIVNLIIELTDQCGSLSTSGAGEGWVSACHHCCVVPDDVDAQSLAEVTHHLVLDFAKVPPQLPP